MSEIHPELVDDYDVLSYKREKMKRLDEIVEEIDCDWGGATITNEGHMRYRITFSYNAGDHPKVFPKFEELLEWSEKTDYQNKLEDDRYILYKIWLDFS